MQVEEDVIQPGWLILLIILILIQKKFAKYYAKRAEISYFRIGT